MWTSPIEGMSIEDRGDVTILSGEISTNPIYQFSISS